MRTKPLRVKNISSETDNNLVTFIEMLQKINTEAPLAKLNETTISDNNGGRIKL
jgi:hypothetical protein